jgi:hypothetical protein
MLCSCEGWLNSGKEYVLLSQHVYRFSRLPVFSLLGNVDIGDCYQKKPCNLVFIAAKICIAINCKVGYFTFTFKSFSRRSYPERLTNVTMDGRNVKLCIREIGFITRLRDIYCATFISSGCLGIPYDKKSLLKTCPRQGNDLFKAI